METNKDVRACVIELAAAQLNISPDKITDETTVPDINTLVLDAASSLSTLACITDVQNFSTVGDAIKVFAGRSSQPKRRVPVPFEGVFW